MTDWLGLTGVAETKVTESKAPGLDKFPTQDDAKYAIENNFGYGTGLEPYIQAEVARIYKKNYAGELDAVLAQPTENADLTKISNLGLRERVGTVFAQAALAANRDPIATLGFDPSRMNLQVKMGDSNLAGFFDPEKDQIWMNAIEKNKSTAVHESIHRGLEQLKQSSPEAKEIMKKMPEEYMVRYIMATTMGNPEEGKGSEADRQRKMGLDLFSGKDTLSRENLKNLERLRELAAEAYKDRRPRGPR